MNKQIEDMAVILTDGGCKECNCDADGRFNCLPMYDAELLYNAGYRKASDVAREICQDIIEPLWKAWKNDASQEKVLLVAMILETINYQIKKKYESEGAE